jgi:ABC-type multidrug transport system ATPase subunit
LKRIDDGVRARLEVQSLSFSYPGRHMFTEWSASFGAGVSLVAGPNGCGKSTLLKLLAGALRPITGRLVAAGIDAAAQPLAYRREVFWCGPAALPFDHLRAPEYFGLMRSLYPGFDVRTLQTHVDGFALAPALASPLRALSTGTQHKVWLAAALSAGTAVTLLDEPQNALDAVSLEHLRRSLEDCCSHGDRAWIVVSHGSLGEHLGLAATFDLATAA